MSKQAWHKESGASLVAIMVSIALFGIIVVMASQSFRNISVSGRRVEAAMSAREVENVILQAFVQKYKQYIQAACPAGGAYFNNWAIGSLAAVSYQNIRFYNAKFTTTVAPPPAAGKDLERCRSTAFSAVTPAIAHTFYGCYDLRTVPTARDTASKDAFAANRGAFIEMYVKLRNLKTDTEVLCNQMMTNRGFGFEVYYALHWTTPAGDTVMYDTKLGSFNAAY
jgi:type II secretory pathway pseudopilin PulG